MTTRCPTVLAALAGALWVTGCAILGGRPEPVDPGVMSALRAGDSVLVVVALVPPEGFDEADTARFRDEIARIQDRVIAAVGDHFRVRRRFHAVAAMTGTLYSEEGARLLADHPDVARIGLDQGGTGGGGGSNTGGAP